MYVHLDARRRMSKALSLHVDSYMNEFIFGFTRRWDDYDRRDSCNLREVWRDRSGFMGTYFVIIYGV